MTFRPLADSQVNFGYGEGEDRGGPGRPILIDGLRHRNLEWRLAGCFAGNVTIWNRRQNATAGAPGAFRIERNDRNSSLSALPLETPSMTGIQFVTDEKGRKLAVQIDLKRYGAVLEDFWDGIISESRRKEKGRPLEKIKADLVKRGRLRG
jgi:hypothetical protein